MTGRSSGPWFQTRDWSLDDTVIPGARWAFGHSVLTPVQQFRNLEATLPGRTILLYSMVVLLIHLAS